MTHATPAINAIDQAPVLASTNERVFSLSDLLVYLDWDPFVRRWLGYARARLWRHGSAAGRYELQAGDCVQEAIRLTIEGRRRFDSGTERAFFSFICDVIDSLISHDAEKTKRHPTIRTVSSDSDEPQFGELNEGYLAAPDDTEREFLFRDALDRFLASLESDLAAYARMRAEEVFSTAEEYAYALNTSVNEVRNMDRRLRRRREQWIKDQTTTKVTTTPICKSIH
jgi:hypothetical protein